MSDTGRRFADADPDDAWDASDPVPVLLANVHVRLALLLEVGRYPAAEYARRGASLLEDLVTIGARLEGD